MAAARHSREPGSVHVGPALKRYPQWMLDGKPSPTGRVTFATWKLWTKNDPLLVSGLLGPVTLEAAVEARLVEKL